nr:uncharacterized protein LOC131790198 [Pocillopora verrucosa]
MSSSKAANAASSHQEQKEQKVLDVMFLCDEWKYSKGGLSTFNREFAVNLAQATIGGMKIHCYVSNSDDRDREDAKQHGVNLITARSVPGSADPLECLKFPPSQLPNPHLVIGHGRKLGIPAYFLAQSTKCKWVQFVHVYCEDLGKYKESATAAEDTIEENERKHKLEIELCKAADAVVAVGSRLQQKYSRRLLNVEVKIITPGIFGKFSNESKLAVDRSVVKNFNVSLFGRAAFEDLSPKGYDVVANAIGSLGENFELTFVGSSPGEQRKVEQWFLDNTSINRNQLTIRRYCSEQEELKVMFYQSDLVALPSRTEGFGLVALEAISAGVPVLVSGESGIAEALQKVEGGNTVIVGSDEDEDEWARRIREIYEESAEEREANAVKLRENYRKVYSWKAECERFKGLIENVVKTTYGSELNVKVAVDAFISEEQNMQTGMLATESVRCREVQQSGASATSAASGSVSYPQTEDFKASKERDFQLIFHDCYHSTKPQSIEECNQFLEYAKAMKVVIVGVSEGSLEITVKCVSLMILEAFWAEYSSGHLGEVVQNCFVTEKILKELNLAELRLKTTMDIEEYNACKMFFEKDALRGALSSEFHSTSSTSESPQKKEQWEKSEQKTTIVETEKLKGTSPPSYMFTTGREKEQEELPKAMRLQERKASFMLTPESAGFQKDPHQKASVASATVGSLVHTGTKDFQTMEDKILSLIQSNYLQTTLQQSAEDRNEFQEYLEKLATGVPVEGTSPPSDMFTTGREKEQKELPKAMRLQERKEFSTRNNKISVSKSEITEEGGALMVQNVPSRVMIPPKALPTCTEVTCSLWNQQILSPPLGRNEALVSSVMELACGNLPGTEERYEFNVKVKVALSHSASDIKGYELVIKELINEKTNDWRDLKTRWAWTPSDIKDEHSGVDEFPDWLFPFAEAEITSFSSFAVVWRLKSFTFKNPSTMSSSCPCILSDHPGVSVTFPESSLPTGQTFALTAQVQEVPCSNAKLKEPLVVGPILHISTSEPVQLLAPARLTIPVTLREDIPKCLDYLATDVRIFCRTSEEDEREWNEVTEQLENIAVLENGTVTFTVNHFSSYWVWIDRLKLPFVTLKNAAYDFCRRLMLQEVGFFARLYATGNPTIYVLILYCFPLHLREQVQTPLSPDLRRLCAQGGGNSLKPLCKEDWMSVSLSEAFTLMQEVNLDNFLKFLGTDHFVRSLRVSISDLSNLQVELYMEKQSHRDKLCTLNFTPTLPDQTSSPRNLPSTAQVVMPEQEEDQNFRTSTINLRRHREK